MNHLIFDWETLSADQTSCITIDCSAFVFDDASFITNPYSLDTISEIKRFKLSIKDQKTYGYTSSKDTMEFWLKQAPEVQQKLHPKPDDLTVVEFCDQFLNYISEYKLHYWWSRNNSFDPIILWRLMKDAGRTDEFNKICPHWKLRDTRTWIHAKLNNNTSTSFCPIADKYAWEESFKLHDSSWDILADVLRIQAIARVEKGLEL